jgi:hypothetical protein
MADISLFLLTMDPYISFANLPPCRTFDIWAKKGIEFIWPPFGLDTQNFAFELSFFQG